MGQASRRVGALGADTESVLRAARLVLATFVWWRSQAKRREAVKSVTPFLPIAMGPLGAKSVVEVELRSRTRLRFEGEAALAAVVQLVARVK